MSRLEESKRLLVLARTVEGPERERLYWQIVCLNRGIANYLARWIRTENADDDKSEAMLALYDAVVRWDPERGNLFPLARWAFYRRRAYYAGRIGLHLSADVSTRVANMRRLERRRIVRGEPVDLSTLARLAGWHTDPVSIAVGWWAYGSSDEGWVDLWDVEAEGSEDVEALQVEPELPDVLGLRRLDRVREGLMVRSNAVLDAYFSVDEPSLEDVGQLMGCTRQRVQQIRDGAVKWLKEDLLTPQPVKEASLMVSVKLPEPSSPPKREKRVQVRVDRVWRHVQGLRSEEFAVRRVNRRFVFKDMVSLLEILEEERDLLEIVPARRKRIEGIRRRVTAVQSGGEVGARYDLYASALDDLEILLEVLGKESASKPVQASKIGSPSSPRPGVLAPVVVAAASVSVKSTVVAAFPSRGGPFRPKRRLERCRWPYCSSVRRVDRGYCGEHVGRIEVLYSGTRVAELSKAELDAAPVLWKQRLQRLKEARRPAPRRASRPCRWPSCTASRVSGSGWCSRDAGRLRLLYPGKTISQITEAQILTAPVLWEERHRAGILALQRGEHSGEER